MNALSFVERLSEAVQPAKFADRLAPTNFELGTQNFLRGILNDPPSDEDLASAINAARQIFELHREGGI